MSARGTLFCFALLAASAPSNFFVAAAGRSLAEADGASAQQAGTQTAGTKPRVVKLDWHVTVEVVSPDCFERPAILVNGVRSPTLKITQGDILQLTVHNDMPEHWPSLFKGISIHFHGWDMRGVPWYDGTAYVEVCPIPSGKKWTVRFQVNEMPGTYFWHGHAGADKVDGLSGPLIVLPRGDTPVPLEYDGEHILYLEDWWHTAAGPLSMPLNRPFDSARQTNNSGGFGWVGNPQAVLINGRGFYGDCALGPAGNSTPINCSVASYWVPPGRTTQQPWASATNAGCSHTNITVTAGNTYLIRIISSTSLTYQTVCFKGHDVTIVAADAVPVQPIQASALNGCIDINSGQRYDVLLKADQPKGNYWISSQVQYRSGSPSGFAVLHYRGAAKALPKTPTPQPGSVLPWTPEQTGRIVMSSAMLKAKDKTVGGGVYRLAMRKVPNPTLTLHLNITQPLMNQTGQIRWAINNVAAQNPTPCQPLLDLVYKDPKWIQRNVVPASKYNSKKGFNSSALGVEEGRTAKVDVFLTTADENKNPPPIYPTAGRSGGDCAAKPARQYQQWRLPGASWRQPDCPGAASFPPARPPFLGCGPGVRRIRPRRQCQLSQHPQPGLPRHCHTAPVRLGGPALCGRQPRALDVPLPHPHAPVHGPDAGGGRGAG